MHFLKLIVYICFPNEEMFYVTSGAETFRRIEILPSHKYSRLFGFFCFDFWATPGDAQGLLLALSSEFILSLHLE